MKLVIDYPLTDGVPERIFPDCELIGIGSSGASSAGALEVMANGHHFYYPVFSGMPFLAKLPAPIRADKVKMVAKGDVTARLLWAQKGSLFFENPGVHLFSTPIFANSSEYRVPLDVLRTGLLKTIYFESTSQYTQLSVENAGKFFGHDLVDIYGDLFGECLDIPISDRTEFKLSDPSGVIDATLTAVIAYREEKEQ